MSSQASSAFDRAFCATVKALRQRKGWTQRQMATALGVSLENYRKYENRSLLPHRHIQAFCLIVDITPDELYEQAARLSTKPGGKTQAA